MKILITGGLGRIGQETAKHCLQMGHQVKLIDALDETAVTTRQKALLQHAQYEQVDIRHFEDVLSACKDVEAIVHLAAIPNYFQGNELNIFNVNVMGSYHLFQAADQLGIQKVIAASSINYLGNGFGPNWSPIHYLSIDEKHPALATDTYAFSKQVLEETAVYFHNRAKINTICFRFPLVYIPEWVDEEKLENVNRDCAQAIEWLMNMPMPDRQATIDMLRNTYLNRRYARVQQKITYQELFQFYSKEQGGALMWNYDNFWALMSVRNAASIIERALCIDFSGVHPLYVADPINSTGVDATLLASLFYPKAPQTYPLAGKQSLLNTQQAEIFFSSYTMTKHQQFER